MKIGKITFLILFSLHYQLSFAQSGYSIFISKNEKILPDSMRKKLEVDFKKPEFKTDPNNSFPQYVQKTYLPPKGQHFSFYIIKPGQAITKHTITNEGPEQREQLTSLVSRGIGLDFYNLSDFESVFKDTLVIFDTLCLDFSKLNELSNNCIHMVVDGRSFDHFKDDSPLFLTANNFNVNTGNYYPSELSCTSYTKKKFNATLFFLGAAEKEELTEFIRSIQQSGNPIDQNELVEQVQSYIYIRWGKCQADGIQHWLTKN
jgi:hypothetical protein